MKRPLFIWIICTFLLTLCFLISGCVTKGGKKIGSGSVGRIIRPQPAEQFNQSAQFNPIVSRPHQGPPAKPKPVVIKPTVESQKILKESITPDNFTPPVPVKPAPQKLEPIKPTVSPTPELPEVNVELETKKEVNVTPINSTPASDSGENVENGGGIGIIEEEKETKMESSWTDLFIFYGLMLVLCLVIWMASHKGHIIKLKNWWSKDKPVVKKTVKKAVKKRPKKTAKKVQKKKVANKGERKSNLAAKKSSKKKN